MTASHMIGAGIGLVIAALIGARIIIHRQQDARVERIIAEAHESGLVADIEDWLAEMT